MYFFYCNPVFLSRDITVISKKQPESCDSGVKNIILLHLKNMHSTVALLKRLCKMSYAKIEVSASQQMQRFAAAPLTSAAQDGLRLTRLLVLLLAGRRLPSTTWELQYILFSCAIQALRFTEQLNRSEQTSKSLIQQ